MKLLKTIIKNFKILFRLKTSLIGIILGPLLIIALVGLAFNSSSHFQISVGYVVSDNSSLTHDYVAILKDQYAVKEFSNKSDCVNSLKKSLIHVCVIFPKDFVIENGKSNNITFVVDKSRTNIVYSVFNNVNKHIGVKTNELSLDLTNKLISTIKSTSSNIDTNLGILIRLKNSLSDLKNGLLDSSTSLSKLDLASKKISVNEDDNLDYLDSYISSLSSKGISLVKKGMRTISDVRPAVSSNSSLVSELDDLNEDLISFNSTCNSEYDSSSEKISAIKTSLASINKDVADLNSKLDSANSKVGSSVSKLKKDISDLTDIVSSVDKIKQNLEKSSQDISSLRVTSGKEIVNPIETNVETISSDNNKLAILFPYLLMLIIMFIGLMLASTLVIVEKRSKAYFRVFTTPTKDGFFLLSTFLTSFIVVFVQIMIILGLMRLFFIDLFFSNFLVNLSIVSLSISIFIMIGMAIGYSFSSQQGTNMASISVGAVLLFISNMILPLELVSPKLQVLAHYNPYVIASEAFRQSILFSVGFSTLYKSLLILFSYSVIIFVVIIFIQKISKQSFLKNIPHILSKRKVFDKNVIINGKVISSEKDLVRVAHQLSDKEFVDLIGKSKKVRKFILEHLEDKVLSKKIKRMSKKEFFEYCIAKNRSSLDKIKFNINSLKSNNGSSLRKKRADSEKKLRKTSSSRKKK